MVSKIRWSFVVVFALFLSVGASHAGPTVNFQAAPLKGANEAPANESKGTGVATFHYKDGVIKFKLNVANLTNVFAAHIHCGAPGVNGPVGVTLFQGDAVTPHGGLASGDITAPNPGNACAWETVEDVVAALASGDTYVNVHTLGIPSGEIRGQVR